MRRAFFVLLLAACATVPPQPSPNQPISQTVVDDQTRETIESLRQAVNADPTDGTRVYVLAQYLDQTNDTAEALKWLGELERIGWTHGVNDHDFLNSAKNSEYTRVASVLNARAPQVVSSSPAFTIPQRDLIPEGIAWDATTGDFYVSSIYQRKIVRVTSDGKSSDFTTEGQDGLLATLGLKVDAQRRLLWVVSTAAREMKGYTNAVDGQSRVVAYDLRTGKPVTAVDFGDAHNPSLLNDLAILDDGSVVITDSDGGGIMRIRLGSDSIEPWIPAHTFTFPNGIALAPAEHAIYVADFNGISRVETGSRTITPLRNPLQGETLSGIDGLAWYNGALIGIQNGVGRARVIRINLNETHDEIASVDVLESGNPLFDEPTTGAIANGAFYFMANPQLRAFGADHKIWPMSRLHDVVVVKLPLSLP